MITLWRDKIGHDWRNPESYDADDGFGGGLVRLMAVDASAC